MFEFLPLYAKVYLLVITGLFGAVMGSAMNCLAITRNGSPGEASVPIAARLWPPRI